MIKKTICSCGAVGFLAMAGCQSGMYSSDVSVDRKGNGVSDYTVVESLDVKEEYPQSMPVVVESKSTHEIGEHGLNNSLWFFTLGIVPGVSSEATTYDVTVKTPIGEKSGTCTIEASSWMGWLPIFVPYPGIADERTWDPKLPNATLEEKVRDQLVANLVSQFPKSEYASFAAKNNSPERRAQRAKEAAERERLAKEHAEAERVRLTKEAAERVRTALYEKTVENDLAAIRRCYAKGERYENPFLGNRGRDREEKTDWLAKWVSPRLGLTDADALAGEALLSEFGTRYLPNAYANYEKKRDAVLELQQVFNEEFSQPWTIKTTNPKWNSFNKVLEKFVKARTEYFICHDELCHFWLLSRFGVLTDKDFALIDSQRLAVHLLPENIECADYTLLEVNPMESKISDFAIKYAPESNAIYQKMGREFKELNALLPEVFKQRILMDDARHSCVLDAAVGKRNDLAREMNALSLRLQTWYMDHRTTEKSSEDIAKCDAAMKMQLKPFMDALSSYIKERALGPVIAKSEMIAIPGQRYRMQRTEVTQLQWMAVMGNNPSEYCGPDRPVENVSWNECQEFIKRASQMDGCKYRLPKEKEWVFACRAGSTTDWGRRVNGECGPLETMGWYSDNNRGDRGTHAVALKEPNALGLFDMHGNVWEWCEDLYRPGDSYRVRRGGSWNGGAWYCSASYRDRDDPDRRRSYLGFRLAADGEDFVPQPEPELGGVQLWENGPYWAECNVGASKPEEYGYYFWWGDTVGYKRNAANNGWVSSQNGTSFSFGNCSTSGKGNSTLQSQGYIDSTGNLEAKYDAATVHRGTPWRMPTSAEIAALVNNCTTTWTTRNGVYGRLVTGKGNYVSKSIFLPAAGGGGGDGSGLYYPGSLGVYWSSTPGSSNSDNAWGLDFNSGDFIRDNCGRCLGFPVRPLRGFAK